MNGFVYFIRCGDFIKIGFSKDPSGRLRELMVGNPHELEMLAAHPGTVDQEKALHAGLDRVWHRGEWYRDCPEIRSFIQHGLPESCASTPQPLSAIDILISDLGGPTAFGRAIGVEPSTASEMKRRKSIPVRYWPSVLGAARDAGKELTSDDLMAAHTASESAA